MEVLYEELFNETTADYNVTKEDWRFTFVENRYDEPLTEAYALKRWPSLYVIDNGMAYAWDKYEWATNETLKDWILNKEYLNTGHKFYTPKVLNPEEF